MLGMKLRLIGTLPAAVSVKESRFDVHLETVNTKAFAYLGAWTGGEACEHWILAISLPVNELAEDALRRGVDLPAGDTPRAIFRQLVRDGVFEVAK